jgi:hypothetical protein
VAKGPGAANHGSHINHSACPTAPLHRYLLPPAACCPPLDRPWRPSFYAAWFPLLTPATPLPSPPTSAPRPRPRRRFLLEWLSFTHRYIPVGLLEVLPQAMHWRPPAFVGRSDLETLLGSDNAADWVALSEMLLGPAPPVSPGIRSIVASGSLVVA